MLTIHQLEQNINTILATYNGISDRVIDIAPTQAHISGDDGEIIKEWISPIAIKQIQSATLTTSATIPSDLNVGDHIRLNLAYNRGTWVASNIVADPVPPLSIASVLNTFGEVAIAFTYTGDHANDKADAIALESYRESDEGRWFDPEANDTYRNIIANDGVTIVYEADQANLAVNQHYTGVLTDIDGELHIDEIKTIGNRAVTAEGIEPADEPLSKNQADLLATVLSHKRVADLAGVDVATVAIAANTQALENLEAKGLTVYPDNSKC